MAITADPRIIIHPIDVARYELMVERGVLGDDDHVELLKGVLSEMSPQGEEHSEVIDWLAEEFTLQARAAGYKVRTQMPMRFLPASMPEPDLALVRRDRRGHPATAWLVIEVSATSLPTDLGVKAELYAAAGVDELWVVDLPARMVHVHRGPEPAGYRHVERHTAGTLRPVAVPAPAVDVVELFSALG